MTGVHGLGELEAAVMDVLWRTTEPMKVRDVIERLDARRHPAYTTVMTVLDNLHRKDWVRREKQGRAYLYEAATTRDEAAARAARHIIETSGDPHAVLMHFVASSSAEETAMLRSAVRNKRTRRR